MCFFAMIKDCSFRLSWLSDDPMDLLTKLCIGWEIRRFASIQADRRSLAFLKALM
jgi:hypothetical protein